MRLPAALAAWGGSVDSSSKRKRRKPRKRLENAARTPSRLHAALGRVYEMKPISVSRSFLLRVLREFELVASAMRINSHCILLSVVKTSQ